MIGRSRSVLIFAIACGAVAAARQPTRDNVPVAASTASIAGTVFVAGDGEAASSPRAGDAHQRRAHVARSDDDDRRQRRVRVSRSAGGPVRAAGIQERVSQGQLRGSAPDRAGTPVVVKDGEALTGLALTIARGGVITGIVRDLGGRPVPGMNVRVLKLGYNAVTGERTLGAPSTGSAAFTDDRGEYRAYGLPPGGYVVAVVPAVPSGRGNEDIRQLTAADVRRALQAARSGASTAAAKPGQSSLPPSTPRVNYAPVFHPGATDIGAAATIALGVSEERTGVDVTIQLVPSATVSGTITSPSGPLPPSLSVRLVPAGAQPEMLAGAGVRGPSAQLQADGKYVINGVAPGSYTVKAGIGFTRGRGGTAPNTPALWASADVHVSGADVDVPLTLQPGVPISGRVVFEGAQPTAAELESLSFMLVAPAAGGEIQGSAGGRVNAEGRFTFAAVVPDTYRFVTTWNAPSASNKWTIKSSTANGREAFEAPLRVNSNEPLDWTITFTDKPTSLIGVLQDSGGRAATDYYILVFSSDRKHRTPGSRRVRMTRPGTDGSFSVKGLPPGEYFIAALPDLEAGEWNEGIPCGREQGSRDSSCGFGRCATCRLSADGSGSSRCCIGCGTPQQSCRERRPCSCRMRPRRSPTPCRRSLRRTDSAPSYRRWCCSVCSISRFRKGDRFPGRIPALP